MATSTAFDRGRLVTDQEHEAIGALEATARFLEAVESEADNWKWVMIALHNAVQGFMVLALNGSQHWGALRDEDIELKCSAERDFRAAMEAGDQAAAEIANNIMLWNPPKNPAKLAQFLDLYRRTKRDRWPMKQGGISQAFTPRKTDDRCIRALNDVRNEYSHFVFGGRSYLLSQFPAITATGLHHIAFLANDCGNIYLHARANGDDSRKRFDVAMRQANDSLTRIAAAYANFPLIVKPACGSTPVPLP